MPNAEWIEKLLEDAGFVPTRKYLRPLTPF